MLHQTFQCPLISYGGEQNCESNPRSSEDFNNGKTPCQDAYLAVFLILFGHHPKNRGNPKIGYASLDWVLLNLGEVSISLKWSSAHFSDRCHNSALGMDIGSTGEHGDTDYPSYCRRRLLGRYQYLHEQPFAEDLATGTQGFIYLRL